MKVRTVAGEAACAGTCSLCSALSACGGSLVAKFESERGTFVTCVSLSQAAEPFEVLLKRLEACTGQYSSCMRHMCIPKLASRFLCLAQESPMVTDAIRPALYPEQKTVCLQASGVQVTTAGVFQHASCKNRH